LAAVAEAAAGSLEGPEIGFVEVQRNQNEANFRQRQVLSISTTMAPEIGFVSQEKFFSVVAGAA
jgi:hypothetical protein